MTTRFVNTAILALIGLLTLSGLYGIVWQMQGWVYEAHRIFAWALIALIPWKTIISLRSLRRAWRPNFNRGLLPLISMALSAVTLFVILLGLMWAWQLGPDTLWLRETVLSWHWILALILLPPFGLHAWRRWPKPKKADLLSRAGFLKVAGLSVLGALGWRLGARQATARQEDTAPRRVTGSRLAGYLSGNQFPVTTGAGDGQQEIDPEKWRLRVTSAVGRELLYSYDEILEMPAQKRTATLDCTIGWYTVQRWEGVPLSSLLAFARAPDDIWGVKLHAAEGYAHSFPWDEAHNILLATHVGGEALSHVHGFPLRAVVPSRRGWFWVKWLSEVEVLA